MLDNFFSCYIFNADSTNKESVSKIRFLLEIVGWRKL